MAKETRDEVQSDGSRKVKYRAIVRHIEDSAEACLRYRQCRHIVFPQKRYSD